MDTTVLTHLEAIAPTFIAIMSVVMYTKKTRWLCYIAVVLAIGAELVPLTVNMTALLACVSCLVALLFAELVKNLPLNNAGPQQLLAKK
jgi:hypothetical protein